MREVNTDLENRVYALQRTELPEDLRPKLLEADVAYLQDRDGDCEVLVGKIEEECRKRGIQIWKP